MYKHITYYVYAIRENATGEIIYIGSHTHQKHDDLYVGSGNLINLQYSCKGITKLKNILREEKYIFDKYWTKEILRDDIEERSVAYEEEKALINYYHPIYNISH